jgi:quinolinate synthase
MVYRLKKENPSVNFYPVKEKAIGANMKKNNLSKLHRSLQDLKPVVKVPAGIADRARSAIRKMIEI